MEQNSIRQGGHLVLRITHIGDSLQRSYFLKTMSSSPSLFLVMEWIAEQSPSVEENELMVLICLQIPDMSSLWNT